MKMQTAAKYMKVIEIAQKIDYLNSSKFTKVFTEAYGMTPTAYRKTHQRGQSGYGTRCAERH